MPSKRQYDLVPNNDYDTTILLHPEEAFRHGITFQVKYIGMLDVPRPTNRAEIVATMRRIRYEFKAKGIKKRKVIIEVSIDEVKVMLRKRKKRKHWLDDGKSVILNHPIYRIFYVSHDSQDFKIFSYIARDESSNIFKCAVFKSNKKSQAMRIVRTIGQAFEVCHKLAITVPNNDHLNQEEEDRFTQSLLSDHSSDKLKKDLIAEIISDKISLPPDDCSINDTDDKCIKNNKRSAEIGIQGPSPNRSTKKFPLRSSETYYFPHSDELINVSVGSGNSSLPPEGSTLSAHEEIQLMREQLAQQSQQAQEAIAQLELVREQLVAEQTARLEAQTRTHQLLIHNRELLDHIAALLSHLQGDAAREQQTLQHVTLPQHQHHPGSTDNHKKETVSVDNSMVLKGLGVNPNGNGLIENRERFNPNENVFNIVCPQPVDTSSALEPQLLQRLQTISGYNPPSLSSYSYSQAVPILSPDLYVQSFLNSTYSLQPLPQKNIQQSPMPIRHSYVENIGGKIQLNAVPINEPTHLTTKIQTPVTHQQLQQNSEYQTDSSSLDSNRNKNIQQLQAQENICERQETDADIRSSSQRKRQENQFIKPLTQMGTLTATDTEGRVRVIVPVPSNSTEATESLLTNLRISNNLRPQNGPAITRSTSEKVPNRSQLMSQVHRTAWARHTTK